MPGAATHRTKGIPPELTQQVMLYMQPDLYLELRIKCMRNNRMTTSEYVHELLCRELNMPDLSLDRLRQDKSRDVARQLAEDGGDVPDDAPMDESFPEAQPPARRGKAKARAKGR